MSSAIPGREREWLGRALRAPRDRAWIADGYVSDRWLPVSPVAGEVDAFEWKAPVDAIGRGDTTLIIEDRPVLPARPAQVAPPALSPAEPPRRTAIVEVTQVEAALPEPSAAKAEAAKRRREASPRCTCPIVRLTIRASCRPILTKARPRSSVCGPRKSAEGTSSRGVVLHQYHNGIKSRRALVGQLVSQAAVAQG